MTEDNPFDIEDFCRNPDRTVIEHVFNNNKVIGKVERYKYNYRKLNIFYYLIKFNKLINALFNS